MASTTVQNQAQLSSDSDKDIDDRGEQGDVSESDPELQAEKEYAKAHGLLMLPLRQKIKLLRAGKSEEKQLTLSASSGSEDTIYE
uniref:Uncharacterized protein n=1 Tax=Romanomermis culicivorax TaxID=13658 RepID=A0A915JD45_ROMCU